MNSGGSPTGEPSGRDLISKIVARTMTVLVGNAFSKAMLVGFEFFLARALGASQYGAFSICLSLLFVVSNLGLLGLNFGIIQYLAIYQEQKQEDKVLSLVICALVVIGLAGSLLGTTLFATASLLAERLFRKPELAPGLRVLAFIVPLETINQCLSSIFQGLRKFKDHVLVSDLARNLCLAASIPFILKWNLSLSQIVEIMMAGSTLALVTGLLRLHRSLPSRKVPRPFALDSSVLRQIASFSYLLFFWNLFQNVAGRFQVLLAGVFLTSEGVGIFSLFLRIVLVFTFLQTAITRTAPVEFARLNHLKDHESLRRLFEFIAQSLLIISLLIALPIFVRPSFWLGLFGKAYSTQPWLLLPLVLGQVVNVGTGPIGHLLISCGAQSAVFLAALIASTTQLVSSCILMPTLGVAGAVFAETATTLSLVIIRHTLSYKYFGIHFLNRQLLALLSIFGLSALSGFLLALKGTGVASLVRGSAASIAVFACLMLAYSYLDKGLASNLAIPRSRSNP